MRFFWTTAFITLGLIFVLGIDAKKLRKRVAELEAKIAKLKGYEQFSVYDLAWQSLHMAAAAACRGSTDSGGSGPWHNKVLVRDKRITCKQICGNDACDAEVSVYGSPRKATQNGQNVGFFYNYGCNNFHNQGTEATGADQDVMNPPNVYFSFCCCRV